MLSAPCPRATNCSMFLHLSFMHVCRRGVGRGATQPPTTGCPPLPLPPPPHTRLHRHQYILMGCQNKDHGLGGLHGLHDFVHGWQSHSKDGHAHGNNPAWRREIQCVAHAVLPGLLPRPERGARAVGKRCAGRVKGVVEGLEHVRVNVLGVALLRVDAHGAKVPVRGEAVVVVVVLVLKHLVVVRLAPPEKGWGRPRARASWQRPHTRQGCGC